MPGSDPLLLVMLVCIAVIIAGPKEYVSLAGFGIMGAIAAVLLSGGGPGVLPRFALAGAGAVLLGVRTIGMLAGAWDHDATPPEHRTPRRSGPEDTPENRIWR